MVVSSSRENIFFSFALSLSLSVDLFALPGGSPSLPLDVDDDDDDDDEDGLGGFFIGQVGPYLRYSFLTGSNVISISSAIIFLIPAPSTASANNFTIFFSCN